MASVQNPVCTQRTAHGFCTTACREKQKDQHGEISVKSLVNSKREKVVSMFEPERKTRITHRVYGTLLSFLSCSMGDVFTAGPPTQTLPGECLSTLLRSLCAARVKGDYNQSHTISGLICLNLPVLIPGLNLGAAPGLQEIM